MKCLRFFVAVASQKYEKEKIMNQIRYCELMASLLCTRIMVSAKS